MEVDMNNLLQLLASVGALAALVMGGRALFQWRSGHSQSPSAWGAACMVSATGMILGLLMLETGNDGVLAMTMVVLGLLGGQFAGLRAIDLSAKTA